MKSTAVVGTAAALPGCVRATTEAELHHQTDPLLDPTLLKKILEAAMSRGGDFADVFVEDTSGTSFSLEENKVRSAQTGFGRGVGIRVLAGQKIGYAYCEGFDPQRLIETAKTAAFIADAKPGQVADLTDRRTASDMNLMRVDPAAVASVTRAELLMRGNEAAHAFDGRVKQVMGSYFDAAKRVTIANSDGLLINDYRVLQRLHFVVVAEGDGDRRTGFHGGGGRSGFEFFEGFPPEQAAKEAARQATAQLGAAEAPVGEQTVVLANGWSGILLHEAVGHGLEADFIRKGTSLYTGKVGEKVASELCTVIDDGQLPGRRGSLAIDDEGAETQRKVLIENGILKGYLVDRHNGSLMNLETTGSGRRESFRHYVMPRMTNTFLAPGTSSPKDIIGSVKNGFYAKNFGGGQVDITNGNFVFEVAEGYLIENGELTRPVKGATLIGVGPEVLKQVDMVGNDPELDAGIGTCGKNGQSVPVGVGLPHVRIAKLTVGGTKKSMKAMV
ncbi:MAG: TldD/PmbA family protein [Deltaproteobacteria bacterium]|nr:TldD/PmbA family protein [Deltaproteobacteria bacterium]MCB9478268.1 TldD/PmbA family protein [Deltaproteobacteria bacterium]MCB9487180.1 TldD/PmbA family protein [Deltaproteobacteria bacterium]